MAKELITAERLRELLSYDPETGSFAWRGNMKGRANGRPIAPDDRGYVRITIDCFRYYGHRLAWLYVNGCWPERDIDHANGDRSDNRICNLREATMSQNLANARRREKNAAGFKGVHLHPIGKWRAQISVRRKRIHIGLFSTAEEAAEAYRRAAIKHYGEFACTEYATLQSGRR